MNKDISKRDEILFGEYFPNKYKFGGIQNFTCSKETIQKLLDNDFIDPEECQNDSPTTEDFMAVAESYENILFSGYAVSAERNDYRVTIDGVEATILDTDYDNLALFVENFRYADEFRISHSGNEYTLSAWWD